MINLKAIDEHIAKAKEDLAFWERARSIFIDPRMAQLDQPSYQDIISLSPLPIMSINPVRPYGELKRKVYEHLPSFGAAGIMVVDIVRQMQEQGYVFAAKVPAIAVNEALVSLGDSAYLAGRRGISKLWTKGES